MKFIDEVKITVISGSGGSGASSFRREKFVPFGGPDGGDGGKGGSVIFTADRNINTLVNFRGRKIYKAEHGENGSGSRCTGRSGEDLILNVPVGTIVRDNILNCILADLTNEGDVAEVVQGGRGGLGNYNFRSSTNQAPRHSQEGDEGSELEVHLELKLLADIALIGLPNAGKSTLIASISAAKPKIADYPFTTLVPNLGVVKREKESLVIADIPGLIEDASQGKGLGIKFLKHIERTNGYVHLVDCSMCLDPYEAYESYVTVRQELEKYSEELTTKREVICLTKIDALSEEEINKHVDYFEQQMGKKVLPISAVSGKNIKELITVMFDLLK
jgi:GTPase